MKRELFDQFHAGYESARQTLPGIRQSWVADFRQRAFETFASTGLPTSKDEAWKYTDLSSLGERHLRFDAPHGDVTPDARLLQPCALDSESIILVFWNGAFVPSLSRVAALQDGVVVGSLAATIEQAPELIRPAFDGQRWANGMSALNAAFFRDGYVVALPEGATIERPVQVIFASDTDGLAIQPLNVIIAAAGSRCSVVEHFVGLDDKAYVTNVVTHVVMDAGSDVQHYRLQQEGNNAYHVATVDARQDGLSHFTSRAFSLGARLSRASVTTRLGGEQAQATFDGLYVINDHQHADHYTVIDHAEPNCSSREVYRGVVDGNAHGVFNGRVIVRRDAQKTDADQANHNLVLSRGAEVDTKPQLEIYADDVRCTHGTTVGQLNEDQLFYLRARGMDASDVRAVLTFAFAREIVDRIEIQPLKTLIEEQIQSKMATGVTEGRLT